MQRRVLKVFFVMEISEPLSQSLEVANTTRARKNVKWDLAGERAPAQRQPPDCGEQVPLRSEGQGRINFFSVIEFHRSRLGFYAQFDGGGRVPHDSPKV